MNATRFAGISVLLIQFATPAAAQRFGGTVTIDEAQSSDQYVAGRIVRIDAPIAGDLVVAGQRLIVDAEIGGDLIAAGETVDLRRNVSDDVRAAGRTVHVAARISGHVVAAGEEVILDRGSAVADWAWIAGRAVTIRGSVGGTLRAAGESVVLTGQVDGDANLMGRRIQVGPEATVGGDLILQSQSEPEIAEGAVIMGEIIREALPDDVHGTGPLRWMSGLAGFLYLAATTITAVLAMALLFPRFSRAASDRLTAAPLRAIGAGLLGAIGTPLLIALVFITGIGLIVGMAMLGAYVLMLLLGGLLALIAVAHLGLRVVFKARAPRTSARVLALVIAVVVVLLIVQIPVLGGLVALLLLLSGLGAITGELVHRYRQPA